MEQPAVIIGFAEALSAPEVAWSLLDQGFAVTAFTRRGRRPSLRYSRFVQVFEVTAPEVDSRQTSQELRSALARLNQAAPALLLPLDDAAIWLCARLELPERSLLIGPRGAAAEAALDKRQQVAFARAAGFAVPETTIVETRQDLEGKPFTFPLVFKPALAAQTVGNGLGRGRSWVCADEAEFKAAAEQWNENGPMLIQPFIPGVGEGLFGLATDRGVLGWSGHRRVRMMNPQGSGSSACRVLAELEPAAKDSAERFLAAAGWRGLFMIEMLRDRAGQLWFIEFNGRPWGSMALARRGGFEYPAWAVQLALNPRYAVPLPKTRDNALMCRHLARELLYLLFVLRGSKSKALTEWPSFWTALFQVLRIGRHDRWYNWRRNDPGVFVGDWFGTLRDQLAKTKHP
jgi:predicted ATP-grasp superfamily ATP-dependent carboligase